MRRKRGISPKLFGLVVVVAVAAGIYLWRSPMFERNAPTIEAPAAMFWNLKKPFTVTLRDDTGIRSYRIVLNDGKQDFEIASETLTTPQTKLDVTVDIPRAGWDRRTKNAVLKISVTDISRWNLWAGNRAEKRTRIAIDSKRPSVSVLANSYKITRGGSALVVFYAQDDHLESVAVRTSFGKVFHAEPYYREGYYAALIAWPITAKRFRAWVEARDAAGNVAKGHIPLYLKSYRYRKSKIRLKPAFLEGKIADLAEQFDETFRVTDPLERFKLINEKVRERNEKLIHKLSSHVSDELIESWQIHPFMPLKNGKKVASFGDSRTYYYQGRKVSHSYHMGLDLASVKMASIIASNDGKVVFAGDNGIYGNMPMIDHGLGLYTIYGHCSALEVAEGDLVNRGDLIAKTGNTGLALGDHLHFGILVQGIEVRPVEWMDAHWIKDNITTVFKAARKMIDRREEE